MTINYISIQSKCGSLLLKFLHVNFSVWREPALWMLRFAGILIVWLWLLTLFAAWPGRVPDDELGPVWFSFVGWQLHAPWAGTLWALGAEGFPPDLAWWLRLSGLIMVVPGCLLAKLLVGDCPPLPKRQDSFAYGGHLLEDAKYQLRLGHVETSGVIVGRIKGLLWQKLSQLVRIAPSTECVILGEGRVAKDMFYAALKGFDGAVIHIGTSRLFGDLIADRDLICVAHGGAASCPMDPLCQVRESSYAWSDVKAMLYPCHFNERQLVLATALLVHGLETAIPHRRTLADVVVANEDAGEAYARLNGWVGQSPILSNTAKRELEGLLDYWAQAQGQLADDLEFVRKRLWGVQYGWRCSSLGEHLPRLADMFTTGPRVVSFEVSQKRLDDMLDPLSLPLMQLRTLLRCLIGSPHYKQRRPVLLAVEADLPKDAMDLVKLVLPKLKHQNVSLVIHARSAKQIRTAFGLGERTPLDEAFETVIITQPSAQALRDTTNTLHITNKALASVQKGEVIVATSCKRPVRLNTIVPNMVPLIPAAPKTTRPEVSEPWSEPAVAYQQGVGFPKAKPVAIPKPTKTSRQKPSVTTEVVRPEERSARTPQTNLLVSKDDLASSAARLKKALAKRANNPSSKHPRTI